jgi:hypothetical protein
MAGCAAYPSDGARPRNKSFGQLFGRYPVAPGHSRADDRFVNHTEVIMSHITHAEPIARVSRRAIWILAALAVAAIAVTLLIVELSGSGSSSEPSAKAAGTASATGAQVNYEQLPAYPSPDSSPQVDYEQLPAYPSPRTGPGSP